MRQMNPIPLLFACACLTLSGCSEIPSGAYYNRGEPEALLDVSSEVVNFQLKSEGSVVEVAEWVNQDQPTRAELYCKEGDSTCDHTRSMLEQFGVPVLFVSASDNTVTLIYERVLARGCENRFIDNSINPYHMNHPTFGCSIASNMVQMVTDKQQFISPGLLDFMDGHKVQQSMNDYNRPHDFKDSIVDSDFKTLFESTQ